MANELREVVVRNPDNSGVVSENESEQLRANLTNMLESIKNKPSFFARVAYFWGERPWWLKVLIGLAVIAPIIVIGIITQSITFMIIGTFITGTYTLISRLLDNFHQADSELFKKLQEGISSMGDLLGETINALGTVRQNLTEQVSRFTGENGRLNTNNDTLAGENERLKNQVRDVMDRVEKLGIINEEISQSRNSLQVTSSQNEEIIRQKEALLEQIKQEQAEFVQNFEKRIEELKGKNEGLQALLNTANKSIEILNGLNDDVEDVNQENKMKAEEFINSVNATLDEKGSTIIQILTQTSQTSNQLEETSQKLLDNVDKNTELFEQQRAQLTRMGAILNASPLFFQNNEAEKESTEKTEGLGLH